MDTNTVSPMPDMAPIAEFDKSPPSPTELSRPATAPMDDLPPPPSTALSAEEGQLSHKKKNYDDEDEEKWGCGTWCEYLLVVVLACLLLVAALTLVLFWVIYYKGGFAWRENPEKLFNLHPVLMIGGYIFFSGFSLLLYRICRCCRRIYVKLFHALLHALAIPCVVIGFLAVWDARNLGAQGPQGRIPHFYSLHSWLGIVTSGLFAIQFVVGLFSFLVLLCCEGATAAFRAALVPVHSTFGITTFMLAVATCLTGLTQKTLFDMQAGEYKDLPQEAIIINALAMVLVGLGILISYAVRRSNLRGPSPDDNDFGTERL